VTTPGTAATAPTCTAPPMRTATGSCSSATRPRKRSAHGRVRLHRGRGRSQGRRSCRMPTSRR
jgi:hypothetical protein